MNSGHLQEVGVPPGSGGVCVVLERGFDEDRLHALQQEWGIIGRLNQHEAEIYLNRFLPLPD